MENSEAQSQMWPIILNVIASFFGAFGQYFYKLGGKRLGTESIWTNWPLGLGVILFCAVMVLFVVGFKMGGRLSVVFPFYALTFVWGAMIGFWLEKEPVNLMQWGGIALVVVGISVVAIGSRV